MTNYNGKLETKAENRDLWRLLLTITSFEKICHGVR